MQQSAAAAPGISKQAILEKVAPMARRFGERAAAAEEARRIPQQSADEMLAAGFARILLPERIGGYGLGFDTWFDVMVELSKTCASHGWCAGLIVHHAHVVAQFPEAAQRKVWADGLDVSVAASFAPNLKAVPVAGGYRLSGKGSPFVSGVDHASWVMLGGMAQQQDGGAPDYKLFLLPPGAYTVNDTWFTAGMRGTGSKTIVIDDVFAPDGFALSVAELRAGRAPGAAHYPDVIYHTPFFYYAPISFVTPMLGTARGAYEQFRDWTRARTAHDGASLADKASIQVRMARAAADIDAAELLMRRAVAVTDAPEAYSEQLLARSVRDFARAAELAVSAVDALMAMSGTAGFATSHPLQRAWRDMHFMAMHIAVNPEFNFAHFARIELGLGRDASRPFF
jgi:3-hydroxy-9,10-secoandrosta-1,3,5(10)-triene-9,17-dione monooxygenase